MNICYFSILPYIQRYYSYILILKPMLLNVSQDLRGNTSIFLIMKQQKLKIKKVNPKCI